MRLGGAIRVEHHLHDAGAVPQVDEDEAAVVAPAMNPAGQGHDRASWSVRKSPQGWLFSNGSSKASQGRPDRRAAQIGTESGTGAEIESNGGGGGVIVRARCGGAGWDGGAMGIAAALGAAVVWAVASTFMASQTARVDTLSLSFIRAV